MASGKLGSLDVPAAGTPSLVYTVPANKKTALTVNLVNRTTSPIAVRVALCAGAAPTLAEYIEYDILLDPNQPLERGGIVLGAGQSVAVYAGVAGISANVWGYEE